jgi:hypothetical protein
MLGLNDAPKENPLVAIEREPCAAISVTPAIATTTTWSRQAEGNSQRGSRRLRPARFDLCLPHHHWHRHAISPPCLRDRGRAGQSGRTLLASFWIDGLDFWREPSFLPQAWPSKSYDRGRLKDETC